MNKADLDTKIALFERQLHRTISTHTIPDPRIRDVILYALFPGGKRLRPRLMYLAGQLLHVEQPVLDIMAMAMELMHGYSLIHDDLPAMDNDDYRRGKPSCHRAFGEAVAILAGDGMQALAIEVLLTHLPPLLPATKVIAVTRALVEACGPSGMVSGQGLDLSVLTDQIVSDDDLRKIHHLKTGVMILACVKMALAAADPTPVETHAIQTFATHLGLVFQMQDDYLDLYGTNHHGKQRASDIENQKTTFTSLYSKEDLLSVIQQEYQHTEAALSMLDQESSELLQLIQELKIKLRD